MGEIVLKGVELLEDKQRFILNKIVNSYYIKIQRQIKQDKFILKISIKEYKRNGKEKKAKKFSIQAQLVASLKKIESHASDWNLSRTIHSALKKLLSEIEHNFHVSKQGRE